MEQQLYDLFAKYKGYLTSKHIRGNRSLYYQLKAMLETGKVIQIKRGLYRHVDFAEEANWGEVCKSAPQAVLCLFSAWQFYSLYCLIIRTHCHSGTQKTYPSRLSTNKNILLEC